MSRRDNSLIWPGLPSIRRGFPKLCVWIQSQIAPWQTLSRMGCLLVGCVQNSIIASLPFLPLPPYAPRIPVMEIFLANYFNFPLI